MEEEPEQRLPGVLTIQSDGKSSLEIFGKFRPYSPGLRELLLREHILGESQCGTEITLTGCQTGGRTMGAGGLETQAFQSEVAYLGAHFPDPSQVRFRTIRARFSHLLDWAGRTGISVSPPGRSESDGPAFACDYRYPPTAVARTEAATLSVKHGFSTRQSRGVVELSAWAELEIEACDSLDLEGWDERFIRPFQNFLTFATGVTNTLTGLCIASEVSVGDGVGDGDEPQSGDVVRQISDYDDRPRREAHPHEMPLPLAVIGDEFSEVISRWLRLSIELDSVCNLLFGIEYNRRMYSEHRFSSVAQAAESYHRRRMKNEDLPSNEHAARVRTVLDAAPPEHTEWLRERLTYSNEPSLPPRLKELIKMGGAAVSPIAPVVGRFVRRVADSRNFYTHYDRRLEDRAAKGEELFWLTQRLAFVVRAALLRELGLSEERVAKALQRNRMYQPIVERLEKGHLRD